MSLYIVMGTNNQPSLGAQINNTLKIKFIFFMHQIIRNSSVAQTNMLIQFVIFIFCFLDMH